MSPAPSRESERRYQKSKSPPSENHQNPPSHLAADRDKAPPTSGSSARHSHKKPARHSAAAVRWSDSPRSPFQPRTRWRRNKPQRQGNEVAPTAPLSEAAKRRHSIARGVSP